jgi:hypothetical protein
MKEHLRKLALGVAFAMAAFAVQAQTVTKQPNFVANGVWADLGNGPTEVFPIEGNGQAFSAIGGGVGSTSGSSATLTLTATPAVPPCVGCILSGTGITSGTTVSAFNGTTTVTMSAAMTVAASTPISWGAACPTSGAPGSAIGLSPPANLRAGTTEARPAFPFFTQGRICVVGTQSGLTYSNFSIGAW